MKVRIASSLGGWTTLYRSWALLFSPHWIFRMPRIGCERLVSLTINRNKHTQLVTWVRSDHLMKCPPPQPLPRSHWICSEGNLDCVLVLFYACSTNPSLFLAEGIPFKVKSYMELNNDVVGCFWATLKRCGSGGLFWFCFGFAFFPDPYLLKSDWVRVCPKADL